MGQRLTAWSEFIFDRLARGPCTYTQLVSDAAAFVPPGRAYRHILDQRNHARRSQGREPLPEPVGKREKDVAIRSGQRSLASSTITGYVRRGVLEVYTENDVKMVRTALK